MVSHEAPILTTLVERKNGFKPQVLVVEKWMEVEPVADTAMVSAMMSASSSPERVLMWSYQAKGCRQNSGR